MKCTPLSFLSCVIIFFHTVDGMSGIPNRVVSHNAMLAGKLGAKVSWSIQSIKKESESKARKYLS